MVQWEAVSLGLSPTPVIPIQRRAMDCFGIQVSGLAQDVELLAFGPLYQQTSAAFSAAVSAQILRGLSGFI